MSLSYLTEKFLQLLNDFSCFPLNLICFHYIFFEGWAHNVQDGGHTFDFYTGIIILISLISIANAVGNLQWMHSTDTLIELLTHSPDLFPHNSLLTLILLVCMNG